jgi:hypothetical protein
MTFFTKESKELNIVLPQPFFVCEDCGGGAWKKIKKGSDIEKYLIFCRCDAEEISENIMTEPTVEPIVENQDENKHSVDFPSDNETEKPNKPEIPKHLRSRFKPKHHKDRRWAGEVVQED